MTKYGLKELWSKEWEFLKLSASFLTITLSRVSLSLVTTVFAGNISKAHLDGVGLATTLFNVVVTSFSSGYSSVFDTYGPQVYASSDPGELVTVLMRCLLQGGMLHLLILGPYLNLSYIIRVLPNTGLYHDLEKSDKFGVEDFRDIAVEYLRITVLVEFLDYSVAMISKYFAIQGQKKFVYIVSVTMALVHFIANYTFVCILKLGYVGLGLAVFTGRIVALAISVGICIVNIRLGLFPWKGFTIKALVGWKPMIKLGVSGAINMFAEMALYDISIFFSQFVSTNTLSVLIILVQITSFWWSIAYGICGAAATLIGRALSKKNVTDVKLYMKLTLINTLFEAVPTSIIFYFLRNYLVRMFSRDQNVIDLFTGVFWLPCISRIVTKFRNSVNQGLLVAFGKQRFIAFSMTICCYLIGFPFIMISIFLTDFGIVGIILGLLISDVLGLFVSLLRIWTIDMNQEIEKTLQRVTETVYGSLDHTDTTEMEANNYCDSFEDFKERNDLFDALQFRQEATSTFKTLMLSAVFCVSLSSVSFLKG